MHNLVTQTRPTSRFDSYEPQNSSQFEALDRFVTLGQALVAKTPAIIRNPYPFQHGRIIFVSGAPGVGKTHLVEALTNECIQQAPELAKAIFLYRGHFTPDNIGALSTFGGCPVVLIDDLFAEYPSIDRVNAGPDVRVLMQFITMVYEERRLVIVTSNFPLMEGIASKIMEVDTVGRTSSRLRELMANSGEMVIEGDDYREVLASRMSVGDLFGNL